MNISPSQLTSLLEAYIPQRFPVLITGAPGIGKSDLVTAVADKLGYELILSHPVIEDPTDSKGLPFPNPKKGIAEFLPFGDLVKLVNADRPTVCFVDDLGHASEATQKAKMQLFLARQIGGQKISDHVTFVGATNRRSDNAGVTGLLEPVISRFVTIVNLEPDIHDWTDWAVLRHIPAELIAFLRFRPDLLSAPKRSRDIENSPSPRTWGFLAKTMPHVPKGLELISYAGSVGEGAAIELIAFLEIWKDLPSPDDILLSPETAVIPSNPATLYAVCTALAVRATEDNLARVMIYLNRMIDDGLREFSALLANDAIRRTPSLQNTHSFVREQGGELGKILQGG